MSAVWRKRLLVIVSVMLAVILSRMTKGPAWLEGIYYDTALAVRAYLHPDTAYDAAVLVVGLDEASLSHHDLSQRPRALFAPVWAQTLTALRAAGAKVVVFDFILAFSGEKIAPGYDRTFLRALYENRGHVVLGRSQHLLPARSYSAALGFAPMSLGLSEIAPDGDGVFRNIPLMLGDDRNVPALAGAALHLAGVAQVPEMVRLAPRQPVDSLPTLSLSQVLNCAQSDPDALRKSVDGKIVFIGTVLEEEDRKASPSRFFFADPQRGATNPVGGTDCQAARAGQSTEHIPGVYLHAQAVNQVLGKRLLSDLDIWLAALINGIAVAAAVAGALYLRPVLALFALAGTCLLLWSGETLALQLGNYAAMGYPSLLSLLSGGGAFVFRFLFEERHRLRMQNAFGHYLAPEIVRRLSETDEMPTLGGELREASIMFADLSGFTALSSRLPAEHVVALTNQYLGLMAEEIEASNGYIDKYIGDAVMAIWGAPITDPNHATHAVRCAQRIAQRIAQMHAEAVQRGVDGFSVKIGVNSGPVIAGNVGAQKRLNYTAVGDTVNVAARLESVPGDYGCMLIIGEQTAALLGDEFELRELDRIAVKGRATPLRIFEPVEGAAAARGFVTEYARALDLYRNRDFGAAASVWEKLAQAGDRPASVMAARARLLQGDAPSFDWDGVWHRTAK
jgi:adenylate cyclase/guanylate cyclase